MNRPPWAFCPHLSCFGNFWFHTFWIQTSLKISDEWILQSSHYGVSMFVLFFSKKNGRFSIMIGTLFVKTMGCRKLPPLFWANIIKTMSEKITMYDSGGGGLGRVWFCRTFRAFFKTFPAFFKTFPKCLMNLLNWFGSRTILLTAFCMEKF